MRKLAIILVLGTILAAAQQMPLQGTSEKAAENAHTEQQGDKWFWWKVANFALLLGVLGYLARKGAGAFFQARNEAIRSALAQSEKARREAEDRAAEMEQRMAGLSHEIEQMKTRVRAEMAAEGERIRQETERHINRLEQQTEQEIENMMKAARKELTLYSSDLALRTAEQQIGGRITPDVENSLVSAFVENMRHEAARKGASN